MLSEFIQTRPLKCKPLLFSIAVDSCWNYAVVSSIRLGALSLSCLLTGVEMNASRRSASKRLKRYERFIKKLEEDIEVTNNGNNRLTFCYP